MHARIRDHRAHPNRHTARCKRILTLESAGTATLGPPPSHPGSRTSSPYSLTEAVSDSPTTRQAPTPPRSTSPWTRCRRPRSDRATTRTHVRRRLTGCRSPCNSRDETLRDAARQRRRTSAKYSSERSQQINTLILNANDLIGVLNDRRQAIVELLQHLGVGQAAVRAGRRQREKLAPTLEKLNSVTAMLEKNRDNIAKALPGLAKYQITQGETVANGPYYHGLRAQPLPAQFFQPFLDYAFGFRRGANAGQPPDNAGPRAELPFPYNGIPRGSAVNANRHRRIGGPGRAGGRLLGGGWPSWRKHVFAPKDHHRVLRQRDRPSTRATRSGSSGVKVGSIASIEPAGGQAKMTHARRSRRAGPRGRQGRHRRPEPGRRALRPARARLRDHGPTMADGAVIPLERTAIPVEWDEVKAQ